MVSDSELIHSLLARMEGDTLDFKRDQYKLESNQQKASFIKDIMCMANTPRDEPAYILVGVTDKNGRAGTVAGTSEHPDPVTFQNLVQGNVNPVIQFTYRAIRYLSAEVGLFEIPVDKDLQTPVMVNRRLGDLTPGIVYYRRTAQNSQAGPNEIKRITGWFSPNPPMDGAKTGEGGNGVTGAMIRARIRVDGRLAGGLQALLGAPMSACSGCGERDGRIGHGKRRSRTGMA